MNKIKFEVAPFHNVQKPIESKKHHHQISMNECFEEKININLKKSHKKSSLKKKGEYAVTIIEHICGTPCIFYSIPVNFDQPIEFKLAALFLNRRN